MTWSRLVGFGEAMIRLTSPPGAPLAAARQLEVSVGGAELNALMAARLSGMPSQWVTAVPDGSLGDLVRRQVAAGNVELHRARSSGTRMGLYFLESHAAPRPSQVTYDRADSAFALLDPASLDWPAVLSASAGACLLASGITPAVGEGPRRALRAAIEAATRLGVPVAFDVNFRASLWTTEECFTFLGALLPDVTILSASVEDLQALGLDGEDPLEAAVETFGLDALISSKKSYRDGVVDIEVVATDGNQRCPVSATTTIVDAVGAGDALFGTFLATLPEHGLEVASHTALGAAVSVYGTAGDLLVSPPWVIDGRIGGVRR